VIIIGDIGNSNVEARLMDRFDIKTGFNEIFVFVWAPFLNTLELLDYLVNIRTS
jgi:hypothetical protein